ncbi:MAG: tRNA methyltransferase [Micavibrio sp.]|nr:tRNA methyltransferase [Micavibrio sp.]
MISIAMYQPDIPQNMGAMMRLCACMGVSLEIIEPCGFPWNDKKINKSAMDYFSAVQITRHQSWEAFKDAIGNRRIVLMTTKGAQMHYNFKFQPGDVLLAGRESAGVPDDVHNQVDARIVIPMQNGQRSLNIVNATSMILGESLRQTQWKA